MAGAPAATIGRYFFILIALVFAATSGSAGAACQLGELAQLPVRMVGTSPTVATKINGADAALLLDSGAFFSMITPAAARQLHLPLRPAPTSLPTIGGFGGTTRYAVASVDHLTLGPLTLRHVDVMVGGNGFGGNVQGLLGENLLRVADVEYDLADGVLRLMHPEGCGDRTLAYWAHGHPVASVETARTSPLQPWPRAVAYLNGQKIRVMFDTGAWLSVVSLRAAARAGVHPGDADVAAAGYAGGLGPHLVRTWVAPFERFTIGQEEIRHTHLRIADVGSTDWDMLLGADFFLSHRVYVAAGQHRVYFTYNGGPVFELTASHPSQPQDKSTPAVAATSAAAPPGADSVTAAASASRQGMALAARGEYAQAMADLTRACELDPSDALYFEQRGMAELRLRRTRQARTDFNRAIKLAPDDVTALMGRAQLELSAGDRDAALLDLRTVDAALPAGSDLRYPLAADYLRADQYEASITNYGQWLDAHHGDIGDATALNDRCWARALTGQQLQQALADCNAAVSASPTEQGRAAALDSRGFVRLRLGDYARSVQDYDQAMTIRPRQASTFYGRGVDELRLGEVAAARSDLRAATALQPSIAAQFRKLGLGP